MLDKIISGGQTGVDWAAIQAAIELKIPYGGFIPKGRKNEDGIIPKDYLFIEMSNGNYKDRTKQNILESDGTLIISYYFMSPGTKLTKDLCFDLKKPLKQYIIDGTNIDFKENLKKFIKLNNIRVLNIAGPRESKFPGIYKLSKELIKEWIIYLKE